MTFVDSTTITQSDRDRFMTRVLIDPATQAWNWQGAINKKTGYGSIWIRGGGHLAHRFAWLAFKGDIPERINVCHKYEDLGRHNVNPDHLFLGTQRENLQDAARKGRTLSGDRNHQAYITNEQASNIYKAVGTYEAIADEFGVSISIVSDIKRGHTWSCATGAKPVTIHILNNKSGFPGVRIRPWGYEASLQWKEGGKGRCNYLGTFDTAELAHEAYVEAKKELHAQRALDPQLLVGLE